MNHAPGIDPIPVFRPLVSAAARTHLLRALDSGWIGYGPECRSLEQRFTGARDGWALATSSCTSVLYLAGRLLRSLSNIDDPEVIVPAVTFVASGMAFLQAGVRPVVAGGVTPDGVTDADSQSCSVKRAMMERSDRTVLLVDSSKFELVHFERVCALAAIDEIVSEVAPPKRLAASLKGAGVKVVVAKLF